MPYPRIFVIYACIGDERGTEIGKQIVREIRAKNIEAVTDHETMPDEQYMKFLNRELPQCGCLIFVQTPVALQSLRVQTAVNMALTLVAQRRMRNVLRVIAETSQNENAGNQPPLANLRTFDASMDYPRARDKLFIELGIISLDPNDSIAVPRHILASSPSGPMGNMQPPQPSGPMSGPIGGNRPLQPSGPVGNMRPPQPSGPMFRPPAQKPTLTAGKGWFKVPAWLMRPWKTSQTSIGAQPGKPSIAELQTLLEDRPQALTTPRQTIIRWLAIIGLILVLALGIILAVVLVRSHTSTQKPSDHRLTSYAISISLVYDAPSTFHSRTVLSSDEVAR
ncbi:MAG TPA: TIR domain-containing protein [Ktedonobacteraceae bacterium]|nr:TIR domain-containing protein [Ktedonobacteraceae bacterium]